MAIFKYIIIILFIINAFYCNSQVAIKETDFNKIPQKKVREFLINEQNNDINLYADIRPTLQSNSNTEGFKTHTKEYFLKDSLIKIWEHYLGTNPGDSWDGKKVSFGLLFSKKHNKIVYNDDYVSRLDTGQIIFLNLKLMMGVANLAAVFQFITIDQINSIIEFSYVDDNITKGKQRLKFIQTNKGYTKILHTSFYKSNSSIRDRILYPFFHEKISNEFHR
ncbi:MAG: hypothetical protein KAH68_09300, partial [Draconibacterium sp.]|nr:hypothetical protein [Draconibacterium sp.]